MGCALAHPINHINMKTKVLFLWALLCTLCINNALGDDKNDSYKIGGLTDDSLWCKITVKTDCQVYVHNLGLIDAIYGDKKNDIQYGGDSFDTVYRDKGIPGVKILHENGCILLEITYDSLSKGTNEIKLCKAINKGDSLNPNYCPDKDGNEIKYDILISIEKENILDFSGSVSGLDCDTIEGGDDNRNGGEEEKASYPKWLLLLGALALLLLLLCYFLFKPNKRIKKLEADFLNLQDEVKSLKNNQQNTQYTRLKDRELPDTMTTEAIQTFVASQIQSLKDQLISTPNPPDPSQKPRPEPLVSPVLDTDKVKYHPDSNFFSIEEVDNPIFRIYSRGNDFFYTIVDDSATRQELVGIISTYAGCVTLQTTEGEASRIEPVSSGRLYKDGNRYLVDTNNKLIVRFAK